MEEKSHSEGEHPLLRLRQPSSKGDDPRSQTPVTEFPAWYVKMYRLIMYHYYFTQCNFPRNLSTQYFNAPPGSHLPSNPFTYLKTSLYPAPVLSSYYVSNSFVTNVFILHPSLHLITYLVSNFPILISL